MSAYFEKLNNRCKWLQVLACSLFFVLCLCSASGPAVCSGILLQNADSGVYNISYASELEEILGESDICRDDVVNVIDNNPNLSAEHKKMAVDVLDAYISHAPDASLVVYFENLKNLKIVSLSPEEIRTNTDDNAGGYYDIDDNTIYVSYNLSDFGVYHELAHAAVSYIREIDGVTVKRLPAGEEGTSLEEAMTNYLVKDLALCNDSYFREYSLLNYLIYVSGLDYDTYALGGVDAVLDYLALRYPDFDFVSFAKKLDSFTESRLSLNEEYDPELYEDLKDDLFILCLQSITRSNALENWEKYAFFEPVGIDAKFTKYLQVYRDKFGFNSQKQIKIIEHLVESEEISDFLYENGKLYLLSYRGQDNEDTVYLNSMRDNFHTLYNRNIIKNPLVYHYIDESGSTFDFTPASGYPASVHFNCMNHLAEYIYLYDPDFDFSNDAWLAMLKDLNILTPVDCGEIPIYYNDKLICSLHISDDTCIRICENPDGKYGFILYDGNRVLYDNSFGTTELSNMIELRGLLAAYSRTDRVDLSEVLSENYLDKMLYYIYDDIPNITDKDGSYEFCTPLGISIIDGNKKMSARELYLSIHTDGRSFIRSRNGIDAEVNLGSFFDYENSSGTLFVFFDDVMRYYDFTNDSGDYASMTMENIETFFSCYSQVTGGQNVSMHRN